MERIIYREKIENFLKSLKGKMFSIDFHKKTAEIRTINGRLGVRKHCKGSGKNPAHRNDLPYITVWETIKPHESFRSGEFNYRLVNLTTVRTIRAKGKEFTVV